MSVRFSKVEPKDLRDHSLLRPTDECWYLYEYYPKGGYKHGPGNQLISNLKKKPSKIKLRPELMRYKQAAIQQASANLASSLNHEWLKSATLVPIPPSKAMGDADYDDRMFQILQILQRIVGAPLDIRKLIVQQHSTIAFHEGTRLTVEELMKVYRVNHEPTARIPSQIGIFDDMLTAGCHFSAMRNCLSAIFPNAKISGFFLTRRVIPPPTIDFDDLSDSF